MLGLVVAKLFSQSLISNTESLPELVQGIEPAGDLVIHYYLKKLVSELFARHFPFGLANKNKKYTGAASVNTWYCNIFSTEYFSCIYLVILFRKHTISSTSWMKLIKEIFANISILLLKNLLVGFTFAFFYG